jgi:hypothetical protein
MSAHIVSPRQTIPLFLSIAKAGEGGQVGLSPTVAFRRVSDGYYLDFNDDTFKNAGWTTKNASMTDLGGGFYQRLLDLSVIGAVATRVYAAEYAVDDGGDINSIASDIYNVEDLELIRQLSSNRLEEAPGNPGQLTLFDDDGVSVRDRWEVRDVTGGATTASVGAPARRSAKL